MPSVMSYAEEQYIEFDNKTYYIDLPYSTEEDDHDTYDYADTKICIADYRPTEDDEMVTYGGFDVDYETDYLETPITLSEAIVVIPQSSQEMHIVNGFMRGDKDLGKIIFYDKYIIECQRDRIIIHENETFHDIKTIKHAPNTIVFKPGQVVIEGRRNLYKYDSDFNKIN